MTQWVTCKSLPFEQPFTAMGNEEDRCFHCGVGCRLCGIVECGGGKSERRSECWKSTQCTLHKKITVPVSPLPSFIHCIVLSCLVRHDKPIGWRHRFLLLLIQLFGLIMITKSMHLIYIWSFLVYIRIALSEKGQFRDHNKATTLLERFHWLVIWV